MRRSLPILLAALVLSGCGSRLIPPPDSPATTPAPTVTPPGLPVQARVALPLEAGTVTEATEAIAGFGSVWVPQLGHPHGWVVRIDARSGRIEARVPVGAAPGSLAIAGGSVWVANTLGGASRAIGANTLSRIDPASNRVVEVIGLDVGGPLAGGFGAIFVPGLGEGGSPLRKVDVTSNKVVATFPLTGIPQVACGALWITQTFVQDQLPYPAIISRVDPVSGAPIKSLAVAEGSSTPAEADGACVALTGPNSASEEPTESWIARIGSTNGSLTRSARIPFRILIMAGQIWIRRSTSTIQRIGIEGATIGPPATVPSNEAATDNWMLVAVDGQSWVVGPSSAARIVLPGIGA